MTQNVYVGDCLDVLDSVDRESIDLVYVDPPFFTQSVQRLQTRDGKREFEFLDIWKGDHQYADFLAQRLKKIHDKLRPTGSIFFHCDKAASHIARFILEGVFGEENFQSEIIWSFRRWSNSKRGLLNSHQTIFFFSKGDDFKFFPIYLDYSPSTNVDQLMQKRMRDGRDKVVYAKGKDGEIIGSGAKKGVPLGDVWDIPFLNPKARERVGYPTQKPIILLKRIIELTTTPQDIILDPFCGSGTTLVAAQILGRRAIGIDISSEAIQLTCDRLREPIESTSYLLKKGVDAYKTHDREAAVHLAGVDYSPVHRNKGIDGVLKHEVDGRPVLLRVQRHFETQEQAAEALIRASNGKGECVLVVVGTKAGSLSDQHYSNVLFVKSARLSLEQSSLCADLVGR